MYSIFNSGTTKEYDTLHKINLKNYTFTVYILVKYKEYSYKISFKILIIILNAWQTPSVDQCLLLVKIDTLG